MDPSASNFDPTNHGSPGRGYYGDAQQQHQEEQVTPHNPYAYMDAGVGGVDGDSGAYFSQAGDIYEEAYGVDP